MENILKRNVFNIGHPQTSTAIYSEEKQREIEFTEILEKINSIKQLLRKEEEYFNGVTDSDLTESSIHRTIALECEYRYWMRKARQCGAVCYKNLHL